MTSPTLTNPITVVTIRVPGSQGPIGLPGPGNSLSIGTVTTTAPGTNATATVTGTSPSQTLNLTIPNGATGPANSLAVGTVTTGAAGSSAVVTITGTAPSQTINLTLPRGDQGIQGNVGPTNTLAIGTVTTGAAGSSASATVTGTAPNQTLNLTIPRGTDGSNGPANTLAIGTVTTGAAGSSASATVTGTSPNQTLNLTIPRGNAGADGAATTLAIGTVTTGATGTNAAASVTGTSPNYTLNLTLPTGAKGDTGNTGPIGQSYGGGFAAPTANGNLPLTLNIVSNWGITDAGQAYYTNTGAPSNEAGLMMPNIDTGSFSVWRPGAPYQTAGSTTATNNSLARRTATGTLISTAATANEELTTLGQQTTAITSATSSFGRDRGSGSALPNTDLRRGDVYYHVNWTCLFFYTGSAWRQDGPAELATIALRDSYTTTYSAVLYQGFQVRIAATGEILEWQNSFIGWTKPWGDAWGELTGSSIALNQVLTGSFGEYGWVQAQVPKGRKLRLRGQSFWYSATTTATRIRQRLVVARDTATTPTTVVLTSDNIDLPIGPGYGDLVTINYDLSFNTAQALSGSVNTRYSMQAAYVIATPNANVVTADTVQRNHLHLDDVGPATAPPTS